jgi:transcription initiation factor TFIIIB Brf1 subunit/transcription initiation factor TFIIB
MNEDITTPTCPICGAYDWSYWYSLDAMKCGDCGYIGGDNE